MNWWHLLPRTIRGVCTREGLRASAPYISSPGSRYACGREAGLLGAQEMGKVWRQPSSSFCIAPGKVRDFSSWFLILIFLLLQELLQGPSEGRGRNTALVMMEWNEHWARNEKTWVWVLTLFTYQLRNYPISLCLSFLISGENAVMPASWVVAEINGRL